MLGKNLQIAAAGAAAVGEGLDITDAFSTYLYTGTSSPQAIKNGIALGTGVAIDPGTALGGGFFAGFISSTANGVATHALIVAPKATGESSLAWQTSSSTTGATSTFDGAANTALMTNSPAANFCTGLTIGGYSDWYLPARFELDIAYFNLKPTTQSNNTSWGINDYSVPKRTVNYTASDPAQTSAAAFKQGGSEAFVADSTWSSTESSSTTAWGQFLNVGNQFSSGAKTSALRVRAFRKIAINDPLLDAYRVTGEGGLWITKNRAGTNAFQWSSTEQSLSTSLESNSDSTGVGVTTFTLRPDGYDLNTTNSRWNSSGVPYVSWTFRKAPKFFDVVTYTGNGSFGRTVAHNLGSVPGCIIVKRTDTTADWFVYHRSTGAFNALSLNTTDAAFGNNNYWANTSPTSSVFSLGIDARCNANGGTYVAYIFAHDAGGFGEDGDQNVISCGSYTGTGAAGNFINLGWEPQFIIIKRTDSSGSWQVLDVLRGMPRSNPGTARLFADLNIAEQFGGNSNQQYAVPSPTGFTIETGSTATNANGSNYIYIAIRRGPLKQPTDATKVFNVVKTTSFTTGQVIPGPSVVDLVLAKQSDGNNTTRIFDRLRGAFGSTTQVISQVLVPSSTNAEVAEVIWLLDQNNGYRVNANASLNYISYLFSRAPGFFDIVAYTGTGSARTVSHNLGVVPELMIVKARSIGYEWAVYAESETATDRAFLQDFDAFGSNSGIWNNTSPTDSVFTVGSANDSNASGVTYIAYLFASCPGVSKVGSYTGTGTTLDIDCGFTNGARFVLIKRADSLGDWYVWDTARGIVSGNDPFLFLNATFAENTSTDYIDPLSSGFQISSTAPAAINASGGSFIFLAIA